MRRVRFQWVSEEITIGDNRVLDRWYTLGMDDNPDVAAFHAALAEVLDVGPGVKMDGRGCGKPTEARRRDGRLGTLRCGVDDGVAVFCNECQMASVVANSHNGFRATPGWDKDK